MGFFDQLSKKASETMQGAKDKTNKISTEMKLKSKLSEKKDRINSLYSQIGQEVYVNYTNGSELISESISDKCKEIKELNEEMKSINAEILALKNIRVCPHCGAQVEANSEFCPKCGKKQDEAVENN